ncbi:MAG: DUF5689 domain-containing protein [Candidatus Cryptobacteroides sp.]
MNKNINKINVAIAILSLCSCQEKVQEEPFFRVEPQNETVSFEMGHQRTSLTDRTGLKVFVYSNLRWTVRAEVEDGQDDSWFSIYPKSGNDDGRFYIDVDELDNPYPRTFRLVFEDAAGDELYSTEFIQRGTDPYIVPDVPMLSYGSQGGSLSVNVSANVVWDAEVLPSEGSSDISWCSVTEKDDSRLTISAVPNEGDEKRAAVLRIYMAGREEVFADIPVTQLPVYSVRNARLIDISEAVKLNGIIEENLKIQGYVISDMSTDNYERKTDLFIQDGSGAGIIIKLPKEEDNVYPVGTKLTFWITGGIVGTDDDGMLRLGNLAVDNIYTETTLTGDGASPVVLTDISEASRHLYTLVTLKDVHFACPVGTVCNVGTWKTGAAANSLSPVLDNSGNRMFIRTLSSFTQKYDKNIGRNSYDITGIVVPDKGELLHINGDKSNQKVMDGFSFDCSLRLRYSSDIVDNGYEGNFKPIVYWLGIKTVSTSYWAPAFGNGEFDLTAGITGADKPNNSARLSYAQIDVSKGASDDNCYKGYSTVTNWDTSYGGYYYELSTSTSGCTGKIVLSFLVGSFGSASRYYKLQCDYGDGVWTDIPGGACEMWNSMSTGTASASDYTRLYAAQPFSVIIPDAAGKETLKVRLTTKGCENRRCDGSDKAIANTSSFCLYYFAFSELQ